MTTTQFDASEVLRAGLKTWWTAQGTLSSLGTPSMGGDDGSPGSAVSSIPHASVRFADASLNGITNGSRYYSCPVVFQVYHNTPSEASTSLKPLSRLLGQMNDATSYFPALSEGAVTEARVVRFNQTQLSKTLWRNEIETEFTVRLDRTAA